MTDEKPEQLAHAPRVREQTIRVLLVDDHEAIRLGMRMVVESESGFAVAGEASNGIKAVAMATAVRPDIILMDLRMPIMDGIEATRLISAQAISKILVLTTFDHDDYLFGALSAGANGFLLKSAAPRDIIAAMHAVLEGDQVLAPEVTATIVRAALDAKASAPLSTPDCDPRELLTGRELDVLKELRTGFTNHAIGRSLGISETTVKTHVSRVMSKLGVSSRVQAALIAHVTFEND